MTIEFDTVAGPNKKPRKPEDPPISRFFGVGNFKIYPVACS